MAAVDVIAGEGGGTDGTPNRPPLQQHQGSTDPSAVATVRHLEPRPFRPFKSSEEYLWAMKEDLAEWLNSLYGLDLTAENFLEKLETGVTLCQHANSVRKLALERHGAEQRNGFHPASNVVLAVPPTIREVVYRNDVLAGTFHARDNISNFIAWCRSLGIYECLLFETEDLVMRKNERSFILCLLEVARRGAKVGMPAPLLVQMEEEIDREIEKEIQKENNRLLKEEEEEMEEEEGTGSREREERFESSEEEEEVDPPPQIILNDLKSLDEMVRDLVNRCSCPVQFPMIRVSEGKYRIGDTQVLIFVRILRSHVMVRVGGGWDTLEHYLDKHDPCRCKQGHRSTVASKFMIKHNLDNPSQTQMQVTYERSPDIFHAGLSGHGTPVDKAGVLASLNSPARIRRASIPSSHGSKSSLAGSCGSEKERFLAEKPRRYSGDHSAYLADLSSHSEGIQRSSSPSGGGDTSKLSTCDKSSEHSDEGYQSGSRVPSFKVHKYLPHKLVRLTETGQADNGEGRAGHGDPSQAQHESSECSSVISPDSPCSLLDEPQLPVRKTSLVKDGLSVHDGHRTKSGIPTKTNKMVPSVSRIVRNKSQSTENLGDAIISNVPSSTSAYSLKARRLSGDRGTSTLAGGKGHMIRSRSQCSEDSEMAAYLAYHGPGRSSLRLPRSSAGGSRIPRVSPSGSNTWSHRQREARPALTTDLFSGRPPRASGGSQSPSPHRRRSVTPRSSPPRSLQSSPSKNVSPLLQQVLAAANDSEEHLLQKMAELVQQHYGSPKLASTSPEEVPQPQPPTEVMPGENYTKYWLATSNHAPRDCHPSGTSHNQESPEDSGGSDGNNDQGNSEVSQHLKVTPSKIPVRVSPRRDSNPGSTRIPMPTFYGT